MAIKIKVFSWNGLVQDVLTDSNEQIEVEFIDAYTPKYGDVGSDEDAAEKYKNQCIQEGFKDVTSFEIGVYKNTVNDEDDEEDEESEEYFVSDVFNDGRRYVLVVNRDGILSPIRHVVELEAGVPYFQDEFSAWYYDKYNKLKGDEFVYCLSTKEMHEKRTRIEQEWCEEVPRE